MAELRLYTTVVFEASASINLRVCDAIMSRGAKLGLICPPNERSGARVRLQQAQYRRPHLAVPVGTSIRQQNNGSAAVRTRGSAATSVA